MVRWSPSKRPIEPLPGTPSRASSSGSMLMMSMETEIPIPLEMEVRFPHGSTNQVRELPLTRRVLAVSLYINPLHSGPSQRCDSTELMMC